MAYVYFSYNDKNQTEINILACLLQQRIRQQPSYSEEIIRFRKEHSLSGSWPSVTEVLVQLKSLSSTFSKVFNVLDALDEYSKNSDARFNLLDQLLKLQPSVSFLVISRPIAKRSLDSSIMSYLDIQAQDRDVELYVEGRVAREERLRVHVASDPALLNAIIIAVVPKARGMFLLARFRVDSLVRVHNRKKLRQALQNLPDGLTPTYDHAMQRIWDQELDELHLAQRTLFWLVCTFRPLTFWKSSMPSPSKTALSS